MKYIAILLMMYVSLSVGGLTDFKKGLGNFTEKRRIKWEKAEANHGFKNG